MNAFLVATTEPAATDHALLSAEITIVGLLTIAALVAIAAKQIKAPFTVALVLVGLALSFVNAVPDIELSKDLILGVLVPPLIFEATMHLPWRRLKADLPAIMTLAIGGTLIGTFLVGAIIRPFVDVPWPAALAFGALISATDPVAVIALFRSLGVSKRLTTLVEGESLFNDGAAIVVFGLAAAGGASFTVSGAVVEFLKVSVGGLAIGMILGYLVSTVLLKHLDDHLIETAVTLALAFGAYLAAEQIHVSGILAVVAAGIIVGDIGLANTSPSTKLSLLGFWELLSFIVNAFVFLLIGLRIDIGLMGEESYADPRGGRHHPDCPVCGRLRNLLGAEPGGCHPVSTAQYPTHDVLGRSPRRGKFGACSHVALLVRSRSGGSPSCYDLRGCALHVARARNHNQATPGPGGSGVKV